MFIVSIHYTCELSEVEKHLAAHVEYLDKYYQQGVFLASGRKEPRTGGVILAKASSREELEQVLNEDPFKQHGLGDYQVTEFLPTKTASELEFMRHQLELA